MNEDRISRDDAERILREAANGPRPGQDPLTAFLAAAAGPAAPAGPAGPAGDAERTGEEAAVAAFRRARTAPARRRPLVARVLTVKVAVVLGLSATAVGGIALAAGTGTLPGPLDGRRHPASEQTTLDPPTSPPAPTRPGGGAAGSGSPVPSPAPHTPSPEGTDEKPGKDQGKKKNPPGKDKTKKPKTSRSPKPKKT